MARGSARTWCCGQQVRHRLRCWRRWSSRRIRGISRDHRNPSEHLRFGRVRRRGRRHSGDRGRRRKPGVYAVRQGPVLLENLRRVMNGRTASRLVPQHRFTGCSTLATAARLANRARRVFIEGAGCGLENGHRSPLRRALRSGAACTAAERRPAEYMRHYAYVRSVCTIFCELFFIEPGSRRRERVAGWGRFRGLTVFLRRTETAESSGDLALDSAFSCQKRVVNANRTARGEPGVMLVLLCALG